MKYSIFIRIALIMIAAAGLFNGCTTRSSENNTPQLSASSSLNGGVLATFEVDGEYFSVWVTNPDTIKELYAVQENSKLVLIPSGPILPGAGQKDHNSPYHWHLDPDQTHMIASAGKECSAAPNIVEQQLSEFIHQIGNYCPSGAVLIRIIDYRFPPPGILNG